MTQPKYQLGQEVWFLNEEKEEKVSKIIGIFVAEEKDKAIYYLSGSNFDRFYRVPYHFLWFDESDLFPSKEALLASL